MDYLTMGKQYRINHDQNIGTVIFVVEGGGSTGGAELSLLRKVFAELLEYDVFELRRDTDEFIGTRSGTSSKVFGLNLPQNQITKISDEGLDRLYQKIRDEFHLKPENYPLFFIYDRDVASYKKNELQRFVRRYTDPYSTDEGDRGQLLLSYPAVEAYVLSCFKDNAYTEKYRLGKEMKDFVNKYADYSIQNILSDNDLTHAAKEMDLAFKELGCDEYDIDNLAGTLMDVYQKQQKIYEDSNAFSVPSQISLALMELGIIVEESE